MEIDWWESQIKTLMADEPHPEALFRAILILTELGDTAKYITHDPKLNPQARPHGSETEEVLAMGQFLIQAMSLAVSRGIPCEAALKAGLENWQELDWKRKEGLKEGPITGRVAVRGEAVGRAYVVSDHRPLEDFKGGILVAPFIRVAQTHYLQPGLVSAIVTDNGGITSHPAIIARELGIVAVVGTGNATQRIPHGAQISVHATTEEGIIEILR